MFTDRASSTSSEADVGGLDTLSGVLHSSRATPLRTNNRKPTGRKWNQPATELLMIPRGRPLEEDGDSSPTSPYSPSSYGFGPRSITSSSTRYPTTATTGASKSRRSTLLSQSTVYTDPSDDLLPPPQTRFGIDTRRSMRGGYPSPPSSVASSGIAQIYPDTRPFCPS